MSKPLLIGSGNPKKSKELAQILQGLPWEVKSLKDFPAIEEPVEDAETFTGNALIKARYYSKAFNIACLADDSGLVVDALDGAPGVYSARYAGEAHNDALNNEKLLNELQAKAWHERTARFRCCVAFVDPETGEEHLEEGAVEGHIAMEPFGEDGFGYDPLFVPQGHERTFAEIGATEKHQISHRGNALKKFRAWLEAK